MKIGIVGLGLIGGSLGLKLQRLNHTIYGIANNEFNEKKAKEKKLANFVSCDLSLLKKCEIIILALPIKDLISPSQELVASIPKERMQVYFIDNEEYFKRKDLLLDKNEKLLKDNDERMIFFTKGVIETVKKLNWIPDIIHLHGWFSSLFPLYLKKLYSDDPIFEKSKIVSSLYSKAFDGNLSKSLAKKIQFDGIDENLDSISTPDFNSLSDLMIKFSDSVILSSDNIEKDLKSSIKKHSKDSLSFKDSSSEEKLMDFLLKNID